MFIKEVEKLLMGEECSLSEAERDQVMETLDIAKRHLDLMPPGTLINSKSAVPAEYWDYPFSRHKHIGDIVSVGEALGYLPIRRVSSPSKSGKVEYITLGKEE